MKKVCDVCKKTVKEVGRLYRFRFLDVCKKCREKLKKNRRLS
ncbi:MAG: hypothetical protein QW451_01075 [Candidatus Aenigmatarchaeota archaeon]